MHVKPQSKIRKQGEGFHDDSSAQWRRTKDPVLKPKLQRMKGREREREEKKENERKKGLRTRGEWELLFKGDRVSVLGDEKFWRWIMAMVNIIIIIEFYN